MNQFFVVYLRKLVLGLDVHHLFTLVLVVLECCNFVCVPLVVHAS